MGGEAKKAAKAVGGAVDSAGQGIGRAASSAALAISKGDLTGFGNTLLENSAAVYTGGTSLLAGYKAGENNVDQLKTKTVGDAENAAAAQAVTDAAAEAAKVLGAKNDLLDSTAKARKRTPGRTQVTLLGNTTGGGTLFNAKGK